MKRRISVFCVLPLLLAAAGIGQASEVSSGPVFIPDPTGGTVTGNGQFNTSSTDSSCCNGGLLFNGFGDANSSSDSSITFSYQGTGVGTLIPGIYAAWNFTVHEYQTEPTVNYTLDFKVNGTDTSFGGPIDGVDDDGTTVSSQGLLNYTPGTTLNNWSATFTFTGVPIYELEVDFDPGSITINVPSGVPEPASFLLVAPALGLLALVRRRFKASTARH